MPASAYFSLEGDVASSTAPFIIPLDDGTGTSVGGNNVLTAWLQNDQANMPNPGDQPDARDLNQMAFLAWAAGVMMPKLIVSVQYSASTYSAVSLIAPNRNIQTADITLTKNSTGNVTVVVPTAKLPQKTLNPIAAPNNAGIASASAVWASSGHYTVYLANNSGALDCGFTLQVWGY